MKPAVTTDCCGELATCRACCLARALENAKRQVEAACVREAPSGGYKGCLACKDFRELLANKSIDAVMISTPDHWHVPISIEALKAGKDVSCEKPLTRSIGEGRQLSDLVAKNQRVFYTDSEWLDLCRVRKTARGAACLYSALGNQR